MGLLKASLEAAKWALVALILGVGIVVGSGNAQPYLSPSDIPGGPRATFAGMIVGVVVVIAVVGFLQERVRDDQWEAAGRHAGLQPANGGIRPIGKGLATNLPDLTGTVDGVPVTARTERHKVHTSSEGGSNWVRYTLVEAELSGPTDEGAIVGGGSGPIDARRGNVDVEAAVEDDSAAGLASAETGDFAVLGSSEAAVQALTAEPVAEALGSLEKLDHVYVGDASRVVASYGETLDEAMEGSFFEFPVDSLVERVPADAETVTIETKDLILNVHEFRRHVLAAVAIANAFEKATARASAPE